MNLKDASKLTEQEARAHIERIRWPNGPVCVHCGSMDKIKRLEGEAHREGVFKCYDCGEQFTCTIGTLFERSHIPLRSWLMAFAIMCSSKKGVSALQLQRQLGLGSYQTAWHLAHRIRHAMKQEPLAGMLKGVVEVDETYVGGKPRKFAPKKGTTGRGTAKTPVVALVERDGRAKAYTVKNVKGETLKNAIRHNVEISATIMTDELGSYRGIGEPYAGHEVVKHSTGEYVRGSAHTNSAESYFSLLKRGIVGSFHHVSKQHLNRYCDEFSFRWNHRKETDAERTTEAIKLAEGCRLMYKTPTKKSIAN